MQAFLLLIVTLLPSVHIITGHKKLIKTMLWILRSYPNWKVRFVFLMGVSALDNICSGLVQAGKAADTPAAILEQGTTAHQRRIVADLKHCLKSTASKYSNTGYHCSGNCLYSCRAICMGRKTSFRTKPHYCNKTASANFSFSKNCAIWARMS